MNYDREVLCVDTLQPKVFKDESEMRSRDYDLKRVYFYISEVKPKEKNYVS